MGEDRETDETTDEIDAAETIKSCILSLRRSISRVVDNERMRIYFDKIIRRKNPEQLDYVYYGSSTFYLLNSLVIIS